MICFVCSEPAVGQCQVCWRFYCSQHGDRRCVECSHSTPSSEFMKPQGVGISSVEVRSLEPARVSNLQRVIASGEQQTYEGLSLSLVSVEVYDDGFAANFRLAFAESTAARRIPGLTPLLAVSAMDAQGTTYYASPAPAIGPLGDWHATIRFEPALHSAAGQLTASIVKIEWLPAPPTSEIITKWYGPWTFQVTLS